MDIGLEPGIGLGVGLTVGLIVMVDGGRAGVVCFFNLLPCLGSFGCLGPGLPSPKSLLKSPGFLTFCCTKNRSGVTVTLREIFTGGGWTGLLFNNDEGIGGRSGRTGRTGRKPEASKRKSGASGHTGRTGRKPDASDRKSGASGRGPGALVVSVEVEAVENRSSFGGSQFQTLRDGVLLEAARVLPDAPSTRASTSVQ